MIQAGAIWDGAALPLLPLLCKHVMSLKKGDEVQIVAAPSVLNGALVVHEQQPFHVQAEGARARQALADLLERALPTICYVEDLDRNGQGFRLRVYQFQDQRVMDSMDILVDEVFAVPFLARERVRTRNVAPAEAAAELLAERFLLRPGPRDSVFQTPPMASRAVVALQFGQDGRAPNLWFLSKNSWLEVRQDSGDDLSQRPEEASAKDLGPLAPWRAVRHHVGPPPLSGPVILLTGALRFTHIYSEEVRASVGAQWKALNDLNLSLLQKCRDFAQFEDRIADRERFRFGVLEAVKVQLVREVVELSVRRPKTSLTLVSDGADQRVFSLSANPSNRFNIGSCPTCGLTLEGLSLECCIISKDPVTSDFALELLSAPGATPPRAFVDGEEVHPGSAVQLGVSHLIQLGDFTFVFNDGPIPPLSEKIELILANQFPREAQCTGLDAEIQSSSPASDRRQQGHAEALAVDQREATPARKTGNRKGAAVSFASIRLQEVPGSRSDTISDGDFLEIRLRLRPVDSGRSLGENLSSGWLWVDWKPALTQRRRRYRAFESLRSGRAGMTNLGLALEGKRATAYCGRVRAVRVSQKVIDRVFTSPPTAKQLHSIQTCLSTPDVAIIQGPPGTGKTTVIQAVVECIFEDLGEDAFLPGNLLLSGFQHDAVQNVTDKITVLGLGAIKIGDKRGDNRANEALERAVEDWIRAHSPSASQPRPPGRSQCAKALKELFDEMVQKTISTSAVQQRVGSLLPELRRLLPQEPYDRLARACVSPIQLADNLYLVRLERAIRGLRTSPVGHADDGPHRASVLIDALNTPDAFFLELSPRDEDLLLTVADLAFESKRSLEEIFTELLALKESLLHQLMGIDRRPVDRLSMDLVLDVRYALDSLDQGTPLLTKQQRVERVIEDWEDEISSNPTGVAHSFQLWNGVYGATCGQSAGKRLASLKLEVMGAGENVSGEGSVRYNTVIIDESARCSALDLLIPMVQASRRVILVGDHRQLPQVVNNEVIRCFDSEQDLPERLNDLSRLAQVSFFQHLFERLSSSGRCVTLDQQFRMHPQLGQLVDQFFYRPYAGEGFESPKEASKFTHSLKPFPNCPAAWIDVRGKAERWKGGPSRFNDGEAKQVATLLDELLSSDESSDAGSLHTFGIITFYAGQRDAIKEALRSKGLVDDLEGGSLTLTRHRTTIQRKGKSMPRFALGTVDEFQGREYDVVILSTVRGSPEALDADPDEGLEQLTKVVSVDCAKTLVAIPRKFLPRKRLPSDQEGDYAEIPTARWLEIMARRWYGHLMLPNRLCVAMSRQQRQLIIIGNRHDLAGPRAQTIGRVKRFQHLRVFGAFSELCNGKEVANGIA